MDRANCTTPTGSIAASEAPSIASCRVGGQLRRHGVEFNILCTVNAANEKHGRRVYRFFRDELGAKWVQFIPIVERATEETLQLANQGWSEQSGGKRLLYTQTGNLVTERTVGAEQYGRFLVDVFEEWVRHDVGRCTCSFST